MHVLVKRQIFGGCQRHFWRCDTLDGRVVGKVDKHDGAVERACLAEAVGKEVRFLKCDAHRSEYNGERLVGAAHLRLTRDLRGKIGVRKSGR